MIIALIVTIACYLIVGLYVYIRVQQLRAKKKKPIQMLTKQEELDEEEWADDAEDSSYGDMVPDILREDEEEDE